MIFFNFYLELNHNFNLFVALIHQFFFKDLLNFIEFLFFLILKYLTLFKLFSFQRININSVVSFHPLIY
jgi:hypothetical protein